jgi:hypothetical protein
MQMLYAGEKKPLRIIAFIKSVNNNQNADNKNGGGNPKIAMAVGRWRTDAFQRVFSVP